MLYPICCAYLIFQSQDYISFRTLEGEIYKFKSNLALILNIYQRCNGTVSAQEIAKAVSLELNIEQNLVEDVIDDLIVCNILVNAAEQFGFYHSITYNPSRTPSCLSSNEIEMLTNNIPDYIAKAPIAVYKDNDELDLPVCGLLKKRHSCRNFLKKPVELTKLFVICKVAYSFNISPVASAGGLFPLSLYFINRISSEQLPIGLYQYNPHTEEILLLTTEILENRLEYSLNDSQCIFEAACVFFICGDISRQMKKYSNRGYRYTVLEAGHSVQNMTIAVGELGLAGVEYGGFYDKAIQELFALPENVFPLACYAVGYEDVTQLNKQRILTAEKHKHIIEKLLTDNPLQINPFFIEDENFEQSNIQVVVSRFCDKNGYVDFGTGVATTYGEAYLKSVMEAYERYVLSCRYSDLNDCAKNLNSKYLDPREYAPYSQDQFERTGFSPFSEEDLVEWLLGYNLQGEEIYIPADLCFDSQGHQVKTYHIANTSGCAAHFSLDVAQKKALLELIERDAIMRSWFYKQSPYIISEKFFSHDINRRIKKYKTRGVSVFALLLPSYYAFTVLVCSVNNNAVPYFVSGAAASLNSCSEAIEKAFNEWEVSFVLGATSESGRILQPKEVVLPKDHGNLYRNSDNNEKINYLLRGKHISIGELEQVKLKKLSTLNPVFLSYKSAIEDIYIVRAFVKSLIPINFGYGLDFVNHLYVNKCLLRNDKFPHFFA